MEVTARMMVAEFMHHIGSEVPDGPTKRGTAIACIRLELILEELRETIGSMREGNLEEAADGLTDLLYVVIGACVAYGVPSASYFMRRPSNTKGLHICADAGIALAADSAAALAEITTALMSDTPGAVASAASHMALVISETAAWHGLPLKELFTEVHRSNMTKMPGTRIGAAKYALGGGKGVNYQPPDIKGVLQTSFQG